VVGYLPYPLFALEKGPPYPLNRRLDLLQSWSGHNEEDKISWHAWYQNPVPPLSSL